MQETINRKKSPSFDLAITAENLKSFKAKNIITENIAQMPLLIIILVAFAYMGWGTRYSSHLSIGLKIALVTVGAYVTVSGVIKMLNVYNEFNKFDYLWAKSKYAMKGVLYISKGDKLGLIKPGFYLNTLGLGYVIVLQPEYDDIECIEPNRTYRVKKGNEVFICDARRGGALRKE